MNKIRKILLSVMLTACLTAGCDGIKAEKTQEAQEAQQTQAEYATLKAPESAAERAMPAVSEEKKTPSKAVSETVLETFSETKSGRDYGVIKTDTWQTLPFAFSVPEYSGVPYTDVDAPDELSSHWDDFAEGHIILSKIDDLGRRGSAIMLAAPETLPTEERGETGTCKPSGWVQNKYPGIVDTDPPFIYNRAHLLMWAITGLTSEEANLITGTRYFNTEAMLPTEIEVVRYVEAGNEVLYRVTPIYDGDSLLADGVLMEAVSRDGSFRICRYAYNVQPGIIIDYATGENHAENPGRIITEQTEPGSTDEKSTGEATGVTYVLNTSSYKYHLPSCTAVPDIKQKNRQDFFGTKEEAEEMGYVGCKICNP